MGFKPIAMINFENTYASKLLFFMDTPCLVYQKQGTHFSAETKERGF